MVRQREKVMRLQQALVGIVCFFFMSLYPHVEVVVLGVIGAQ